VERARVYSSRLREGLSRLIAEAREARSAAGSGSRLPAPPRTGDLDRGTAGVEEFLPGGEVHTESGPAFVHECALSAFKEDAARLRGLYGFIEAGGLTPSWEDGCALLAGLWPHAGRTLFLDLETTGLHGSVLFLAGFMAPISDDFVVRQLFARDYSEEKAVLIEARRALSTCEAIVTFNGKSYDVPFLKERAAYHRLDLSCVDAKPHFDLLHWSRRRWKGEVPDCRLKTLEWEVCRQRRWGDVPGDEIPGIYHRYVRTGDPYQLVPVFHHNVLDLVTMAELLVRLLG
jgi:uncharacterized protein YprB with RNaseH-like and TPR domain